MVDTVNTSINKWLVIGPLIATLSGIASGVAGLEPAAAITLAVIILCGFWWVTEAIPIPATSLIPFAVFPLTGVLDHREVAGAYGHTLILLLLGGFVLSRAVERSGAHRRLALGMVRLVGAQGGARLILGFMLATAVMSMWISNTATVLVLLPVALAALGTDADLATRRGMLLGLAYAGSIGGLGTPIGTPPNLIFLGVYRDATGVDISFFDWMTIGIPIVVILLPLAWWVVTRDVTQRGSVQLPEVGPMQTGERRVLAVFALTALAWMTRTAPFGGWQALIGSSTVGDSTVALTAVVACFLISDGSGQAGRRLLDWKTAETIPWGLLILFGGGIALARAFDASGLSQLLGEQLAVLQTLPTLVMILGICLAVSFLTEGTSNTATTTLLMPLLAAAAIAAQVDPLLLMLPAALSASCAFMLPVATAPNAVVFATGEVHVADMAKRGALLNVVAALVVALAVWVLGPLVAS
jgi:solute carrier family 13 (sodium-dependent dicarboxylate transporter), member 2/3/5